VPTNKADVTQPADIIEEILRIDGLDNIAIPDRLNISLHNSKPSDHDLKEKLAEMLLGEGFQEIVTNSIVNSKYYPDRTDLVRMLNSLSSELDVMRPSMLESGLEVVNYNCNRKNNDLLLFEFGNIYTQNQDKYVQEPKLALWLTGNVRLAHWDQKAKAADLYYVKGVFENLIARSGIRNVSFQYDEAKVIWKYKNQELCTAFAVSVQQLNSFDIRQEVFFANIDWNVWTKAAGASKIAYHEVPKFPAVHRDLAIVLDKGTTYHQVLKATEQLKMEALKDLDLFDVFESEKLGQNKKSYALSYTFQLQDRTLTDVEIDQLMQQLMQTYKAKLQAQIRE
jgi:phenylalanyl-tRNA synthetase beta chain